MQMIKKDTITSLELLEQINFFRRQEGSRVDMLHKTLLENIRDEFNCNIGEQYSLPTSTYKDIQGKDRIMYILTLSQGKQILARESKFVRGAIFKYIEELEQIIQLIKENKLDKQQQIEAMKKFGSLLPEIEAHESLPYVKINTCVNKAVSNYYGFPKMLKKEEMSPDMLEKRNEIMQRFLVAYELFRDISKAKEFIYEEFRQVSIECNED